jgi:transcriptional regulator with XRE-family HTH domain
MLGRRWWLVLVDIDLRRRVVGQKPIDVIVGERLAALRTSRGVSLDQVGSVLGITGSEVANYESGAVRIPPNHLIDICRFLQVTLQNMFPSLDRDHDPNLH